MSNGKRQRHVGFVVGTAYNYSNARLEHATGAALHTCIRRLMEQHRRPGIGVMLAICKEVEVNAYESATAQ